MKPLPDCLPPPTHGVHHWLYGRALFYYRLGASEAETEMRIRAALESGGLRPGRTVTAREIADTITSVWRSPYTPNAPQSAKAAHKPYSPPEYDEKEGWSQKMRIPTEKIDMDKLGEIIGASDLAEVDLWDRSPLRIWHERAPMLVLRVLFRPDDILCIGTSSQSFAAKPLRDWTKEEVEKASLIVPNPLRKTEGMTKLGKLSAHCRDATGPRRYLILESDAGLSIDEQARLIDYVVKEAEAKLACVTRSGGKSLHAWLYVEGFSERQIYKALQYTTRHGFDPRLYLPEQFCRMPDGIRENGVTQNLIYLARHE